MRSASAIFMSHTEAIMCLPHIIILHIWEERMGAQRCAKVALWCKHCSCFGWWKGTSRDDVTLISEEIKSVALAVFELCLSEGINK